MYFSWSKDYCKVMTGVDHFALYVPVEVVIQWVLVRERDIYEASLFVNYDTNNTPFHHVYKL